MAYKCPLLVRLADNYRWYKKWTWLQDLEKKKWSQCGRANTCTQLWLKTKTKKEFRFYRSLWKNCNQIRHTLLLYGVHFVTSLWGLLLVFTNFCWKERHVYILADCGESELFFWKQLVQTGRQKRLIEQSRAENFFTHIRPASFPCWLFEFPHTILNAQILLHDTDHLYHITPHKVELLFFMLISSKFTSKTEYLPCTHPHPLDTSKPRSADNQHLYLASLMYKAIVCFSHDTRPQREIKQPRHSFAVTQKMLISSMHAHIYKLLKLKDWSIFFSLPKSILCLICPISVIFLLMFDTHKSFASIVRLFFQQNRKQTFK